MVVQDTEFESGTLVGDYRVLGILGKGAHGVVYKVERTQSGRIFALKVHHRALDSDAEKRIAFRNEAALIGRLHHPNIVSVLDVSIADDQPFIVMEYVQGAPLSQHVSPETLLPIREVLEIAFKCCNALDYTHRLSLVHRDIKPGNLIRALDGGVKLTDFGTASINEAGGLQSREFIGSPAYVAPEVLQAKPATFASDMFSLGVVIYQLLTARLPFEADTDITTLFKICNETPLPPSTHRAHLPAGVDTLLERMLAKSPEARFSNWTDCSERVLRLIESLPRDGQAAGDGKGFTALRRHPMLKTFTDQEIWETLRLGEWLNVDTDYVLIRQGSKGKSFYLLVEGQIAIYMNDMFVRPDTSPTVVGEMAYLRPENRVRTATVKTQSKCLAFRVPNDGLAKASVSLQLKFERAFTQLLITRLLQTNQELLALDPLNGEESDF